MRTSRLRIATINILNDLSSWEARRPLLIKGLVEAQPDLVTLQEVNLPAEIASWLAGQLGLDHLYITPKGGNEGKKEGIAILSRYPLKDAQWIGLPGTQGRVAQCVEILAETTNFFFANCHLFWQPGESEIREHQVDTLISWLNNLAGGMATIVCGDFNATPNSAAILKMYRHYQSAFAAVHGKEPVFTCPTPLKRSLRSRMRTLRGYFVYLRPQQINPFWRGTLDYIFVDPFTQVNTCEIILNQPAEGERSLYPSDHFGLCAEITIGVS